MLVNNLCHCLDYSALFELNGILLEEALHITAKRVFGVSEIISICHMPTSELSNSWSQIYISDEGNVLLTNNRNNKDSNRFID